MNILCNNCKHLFRVAASQVGQVQYSKCASVFRVELVLKSPCPKCKTFLKVITNEKKEHVGFPLENQPAPKNMESESHFALRKKMDPVIKAKAEKTTLAKKPILKQKIEKNIQWTIDEKSEITLKIHVKEKLQKRLNNFHRYSVQSYKKPQPKKVIIPNVFNIEKHASQPKVFLSILTLAALFLVFGIMRSVFQNEATLKIATHQPAMEEGMEEYEPTHHDDAVGGPAFPSETDRKTGLEDETIKQITSNLQILHLPPLQQVTSTYGIRLDPFTKKLAFHAGVDFKADMGTKIEAAMDGFVKFVGKRNMYGNAVIIKHANGYETLYGHLSKTLVQTGQKIKQRDIIALAGSTGRSTGPHLHFELIKNGKKIDPLQADLLVANTK